MATRYGFVCSSHFALPRNHSNSRWRCSSNSLPSTPSAGHGTEASHVTASPPRGRRGGLTPEVVRDRRHRRENESGRRTTLVAQWGGVTLAKSSRCEFVEGRFYFPESSVKWEFFTESGHQAMHNPVGTATYYDIVVPGQRHRNRQAAWCYRTLKRQWRIMEGRTTFWKGVSISVWKAREAGDEDVGE